MALEIEQGELASLYAEGRTVILAYKRAYEIRYSHGVSGYIFQQFYRSFDRLPLTKRGRYMAFTPEYANKIIHGGD